MPDKTVEAPGLTFPCQIGVKIFIKNDGREEFLVREFVTLHLTDEYLSDWSSRESNGGKYLAITAGVAAQSREHIDALYEALCAHERVIMTI